MTKVTFECRELEVESQCNAFVRWELENLQQPVVYSMEKKNQKQQNKKKQEENLCMLVD